jgi:hypothetical protein
MARTKKNGNIVGPQIRKRRSELDRRRRNWPPAVSCRALTFLVARVPDRGTTPLLLLGSGPLLAVILLAWLGVTKDTNPNPVGFGMLAGLTFWPSAILMIAVRWLPVLRSSTAEGGAGNGADTALDCCKLEPGVFCDPKRCVPSPLILSHPVSPVSPTALQNLAVFLTVHGEPPSPGVGRAG